MICVIDGTSLQSILNSIGISYSVNITHDIYCFSNIKCSILLKSMPPFIGQDSNVSKKKTTQNCLILCSFGPRFLHCVLP